MILSSRPWPRPDLQGEKYRPCVWCGNTSVIYELAFDSGSVAPTVGETLTGATSGDTAVVVSSNLYSGTYAGGDAEGAIELSGGTGVDDNGYIFSDNETLNGSVGGTNMLTAQGVGSRHVYGRLYPESELTERDGRLYCKEHYAWVFSVKDWCEQTVDVQEDD